MKNKKKKRIGKVNPVLYAILYVVMKPMYKIKYNMKFDNDIVKKIKGPAIVLATHTSDQDHILSALTLYPVRPTYIISEHFLHNKSTATLLKLMPTISKKMFTPDVSTIRKVLRAKQEGAVLVIFPEGRLSCYAHTLPLADGTAELIKKLGLDIYTWKGEGASLTFPKWRDKGCDRKGEIRSSVKLLMTADEVAKTDIDSLREIAAEAVFNDDELAMEGVEFKCDDMSRGVDKILYKCPKCLEEGNITAGDGHIRCSCGLDATLDSKYRLHNAPFDRINQWFEWQQESIDIENEKLSSKTRLGECGPDGFMDPNAGEGEIYMDKDIFRLSGTLHGRRIEFEMETLKIGAFPISPGEHIDIYHEGNLIYIYPQPDPRTCVKWVSFLDKLTAKKKDEAASKV